MNTLYIITALAITALFPCAIYWLARREDAAHYERIKRLRERPVDLAPEHELSPHARTFMTLNNYKTEIGKGTLQ